MSLRSAKESANLVSKKMLIGAFHRYQMKCKSVSKKSPRYTLLEQGRIQELDAVSNEELSAIAGKSTHEIKTWVAAFAAISAFGNWRSEGRYYRPIPEWIAGFGSLSARTEN
ncbi:2,3-dihydroxyphenylpropionate 1,2-dioxygenase [Escherichia coli]|uniref:2,3-dihydroxyphenylpropionate 1,2-dioxygenase n=1 Tax=Escherichia coli TaxID=562 RepID=A0A376VYB1_ECOLX|nr:2,3-dihydroxyphenylpropionate 1,2-dioxygenase [Escherichia coli]